MNVFIFWKDPVSVIAGLRQVMRPSSVIVLTLQLTRRGAIDDDTRAAARAADALRAAGFGEVRTEIWRWRPSPPFASSGGRRRHPDRGEAIERTETWRAAPAAAVQAGGGTRRAG